MKLRHLHAYPKVFNTQGNLKAFPFRRPIKLNFWNTFWVSMAFYFLSAAFYHWNYSKFTKKDFFLKDVNIPPCRKPSFCSENAHSTP
jgi:hypothetical protein